MSYPADFRARIFPWLEREPVSREPEAGSGERCSESFARFDRGSSSWRIHPCLFPEDSPLYLGTWPTRGMMRSGVCWERTTWEPRMFVRDSGCLHMIPTTTACNVPNKGANTREPKGIMEVARTDWMPGETWLTPMALDGMRSNMKLESLAKHWAHHPNSNLAEQVAVRTLYPTPTCQDASNNGGPSQMKRNTPPLNAVAGGALNPVWVEWLMGWPLGWTDCEPLEMDKYRWWRLAHSRFLEKV